VWVNIAAEKAAAGEPRSCNIGLCFSENNMVYQPVGRELRAVQGNEVQGVKKVACCLLCQESDANASYSEGSRMQYRGAMSSPWLLLVFLNACVVIQDGV
jgi:hypothetical protein